MRALFIFCIFIISLFGNQNYKIAVLYWSMNIEGQVAMREGLEREVEKINRESKDKNISIIKYVAGDGERGVENQINQFRDAIREKVDAIVVQPTDNAGLTQVLIEANRASIPVIAYDQYIIGGELSSFITSNNYMAGFLDGEYIAYKFKHKKELKIALVEYPTVSSTVERVNGFIDALESYGVKFKILKSYEAVEPTKGREVGVKILKDFPKVGDLDLVFCVNDGGGVAIAKEFLKAKRNDIALATVDGDPQSVDFIKNSNLIIIDSAQFCGAMGAVAIKTAYQILKGEKVGKNILIPIFPITKETIHLYNGWIGDIPNSFKKPWSSKSEVWDNSLIFK